MKSRKMEQWKLRLGFECCLAVECEGRSGGLALLWKKEILMTIKFFTKFHIDALLKEEGVPDNEWHLTSIYGHLETTRRNKTWRLIRSLKGTGDHAWLVFGDFNEILTDMNI